MTQALLTPPFTAATAKQKVQAAEDLWNTRDPDRVVLAYTVDTCWRNRDLFLRGREAVRAFLVKKWQIEQGYRLKKELFLFSEDKIAVQFCYEWHDEVGQWYCSYGLEHWEFTPEGLMAKRTASINDVRIDRTQSQLQTT